jgi:hypothetical protein
MWFVAGILAGAVITALGVAVVVAAGSTRPGGVPRFEEVAAQSGLDHLYDGGVAASVGGGLATFDCDGNDKPDLYIAGGDLGAGLYRNVTVDGGPIRFTRIESPLTDVTSVAGAYPIDFDGDGITDLAVLRVGENVMLKGLGDCTFTRANELWGISGGTAWTGAFAATWEQKASLPTFVFGNYRNLDEAGDPTDGCADHQMFRPGPNGYVAPIDLSPGYCTLSALFSDWSRTGRRDLRFSNDRHYYTDGEEQLWKVDPDSTPRPYSESDGWMPLQVWGMGIASQDVTGDGYPDVYLTSQGDNKLQTLSGAPSRPTYTDIALARGVTATRPATGGEALPSTAWHPEFGDLDNDGIDDLFVSKGNVSAMPDFAQRDPSDLFKGKPDGTFTEIAADAGTVDFAKARGAALVDLDGDGLLDIVVVNVGEPVGVWHNLGSGVPGAPVPMGNWLTIQLRQTGPNRDAIGAWVEVRVGETSTWREVTIGGGHISGKLLPLHFGLGTAPSASVRVQWPDGTTGPWAEVDANTRFVVDGPPG